MFVKNQRSEKYISKNYPDIYEQLQTYPSDLSFSERLYWYEHNINTYPTCKCCGKRLNFVKYAGVYREYCSNACVGRATRQKAMSTMNEQYGGFYNNRSKAEQTCLSKYGVKSVMQSEKVKDKVKKTNLSKYGVEYSLSNKEIQSKIEETNLSKYGVRRPLQSKEFQDKFLTTYRNTFIENSDFVIGYDEDKWICKCPHSECNKCEAKTYIINRYTYYQRKNDNVEPCTNILPVNTNYSTPEIQIRQYLDELGLEYETNIKNIISPFEIDIYIPKFKIAIEFNGCYWHSEERGKTRSYHFNKFEMCRKKNIQLITIWEDQWFYKKDICKQIITSKCGIFKRRLYARNCEVVELTSKESKSFIDKYHIQGNACASIRYGLKFKGELVCVMTFGKKRSSMMGTKTKVEHEYELVRFCGLPCTQVIGGASKLFKHFLRLNDVKVVKSYSSNDISIGELYERLGFKQTRNSSGSYWYIHKGNLKRYHRYNFRKQKLKEMGFDISNTESSIMKSMPFYKIWDSGMMTWEYRI